MEQGVGMFQAGWQKKIRWIMLFSLFAFWIAPSDKVTGKLIVLDPG